MEDIDAYLDEVVTRRAPRWAWEIMDETLSMDMCSPAFGQELRDEIMRACKAVEEI